MAWNSFDWFRECVITNNVCVWVRWIFFNWDRNHTHTQLRTHARIKTYGMQYWLLLIYCDNDFDVVMIRISIHLTSEQVHLPDSNYFFFRFSFSSYSFWFHGSISCWCCRCRCILLQIPTYYGFNNAGHYLIVYTFCPSKTKNLMSRVLWSNFNVFVFLFFVQPPSFSIWECVQVPQNLLVEKRKKNSQIYSLE